MKNENAKIDDLQNQINVILNCKKSQSTITCMYLYESLSNVDDDDNDFEYRNSNTFFDMCDLITSIYEYDFEFDLSTYIICYDENHFDKIKNNYINDKQFESTLKIIDMIIELNEFRSY